MATVGFYWVYSFALALALALAAKGELSILCTASNEPKMVSINTNRTGEVKNKALNQKNSRRPL